MSNIMKLVFFTTSFFPVFVLVSALAYDKNHGLSVGAAAAAGAALIVYFILEKKIVVTGTFTSKVTDYEEHEENILMYIIAYLPPFFSINYAETGHLVALAIFYFILFYTYASMNLHYLNPMFAFRGYRPYKIVPIDGPSFIALVAKDITLTKNRTYTFRGTQDVVVLQKSDNIEQVSA